MRAPSYGGYGGNFNRFNGGTTYAVRLLLYTCFIAYLLQIMLDRALPPMSFGVPRFSYLFALSGSGMSEGYIWQLVTYMFLHGPLFHLLFNMLLLFLMGPETERAMGVRHFFIMYFLSGILGGVGWLLLSEGGLCVGASGSLLGMLVSFAVLFPDRRLLILPFMIPVKAWIMVSIIIVIDVVMLVSHAGGSIAHTAHLAGALTGYIYTTTLFTPGRAPWKKWIRRKPRLRVIRSDEPPSRAEIDRVLDKIARQGMGSLTTRERKILDAASRGRSGR